MPATMLSASLIAVPPAASNAALDVPLSTPECPRSSKRRTSNARLAISSAPTQMLPPSTKTSVAGSISNAKVCAPYWTPVTAAESAKLWSCTATDLRESQSTSWNTFSKDKMSNSWYTAKMHMPETQTPSPKTSSESSPSLWHRITENEQRKIDGDDAARKKRARTKARKTIKKEYNLVRARKVRVYPTKDQRTQLLKWFGVTRRAYNIGVAFHRDMAKGEKEAIKLHQEACIKKDRKTKQVLVDEDGNPKTHGALGGELKAVRYKEKNAAPKWVLEVPQAIRDSGILDFFKAINSGRAKNEELAVQKKVHEQSFYKFRTKRDESQIFEVNARTWNLKKSKTSNFLKEFRTRKEEFPDQISNAMRVQMNRLGHVYFCFLREEKKRPMDQAPKAHHGVIALDPGVRSFQTMYDADGRAIEWGTGKDFRTIFYLCRRVDKIQSSIDKKKTASSDKDNFNTPLKRAFYRAQLKIKNKITEIHRKLALWLCENYRVILLPKFETSKMSRRMERRISKKSIRMMCRWSHFGFRQALIHKAEMFPWCKLVLCQESYTSKTCNECGTLHHNLGASKIFQCPNPKCNHVADRDVHAARGILLRYLSKDMI
mmetsp:Transcript_4982/g.10368  ORF Transcript_4982/g.10368 Transcript_4982/m.10368 type:complete len:602 (+) Transcript_4982:467-2272(+)